MAVLQPVAHLCGQAQAGLNQCIVRLLIEPSY